MTIPFLYQLQGASASSLQSMDYQVAVVDMDDTGLNADQISAIEATGKSLITYLSIGEAEDYRDYWPQARDADYLLNENSDWEGNYRVKFWDTDWQKIILGRVEEAVSKGYSGIYLDIVDAYTVSSVKNAYTGSDIRQEMIDFVISISEYAKSLDPDFIVIPQNAVGLLTLDENSPATPNAAYLTAIDGIGVEDLWFDDNRDSSWTKWDLEYIDNASNAGKFVLATSYPTEAAKQDAFVENAIAEGFIPFVGNRDLGSQVPAINQTIEERLDGTAVIGSVTDEPQEPDEPESKPDAPQPPVTDDLPDKEPVPDVPEVDELPDEEPAPDVPEVDELPEAPLEDEDLLLKDRDGDVFVGGAGDETLEGSRSNDILSAGAGDDTLYGRGGNDILFGDAGNDILKGNAGNDVLDGGEGSDILRAGRGDDALIYDPADKVIHGGTGFDVLIMADTIEFDFGDRAIRRGIEAIDLANGEQDTASVIAQDVLEKTDDGALYITGDPGDIVESDFGLRSGTVTFDTTPYARFTLNDAELYVELGLLFNDSVLV